MMVACSSSSSSSSSSSTNTPSRLKTVNDRHLAIHEYQIEVAFFPGINGLLSVDGRGDFAVHFFQQSLAHLDVDSVVIHQQHPHALKAFTNGRFAEHPHDGGWLSDRELECKAEPAPFPHRARQVHAGPSKDTRRVTMLRPKPVPPYSRVVDTSACPKASSIVAWRPSGIPILVSRTSRRNRTASSFISNISQRMFPEPFDVNFNAFDTRLLSTWRRRVGSAST